VVRHYCHFPQEKVLIAVVFAQFTRGLAGDIIATALKRGAISVKFFWHLYGIYDEEADVL